MEYIESPNLPNDEKIFLNENIDLRNYFYNIIINIKNDNMPQIRNIKCKNSYERRIVHILAQSFGLYHSRYGEWDDYFKNDFDYECACKKCWEIAGEKYYKIAGVTVSNNPLCLSRKDKIHQKETAKKIPFLNLQDRQENI